MAGIMDTNPLPPSPAVSTQSNLTRIESKPGTNDTQSDDDSDNTIRFTDITFHNSSLPHINVNVTHSAIRAHRPIHQKNEPLQKETSLQPSLLFPASLPCRR